MQTFEHSFHGFFSFLERFSSLDLQVDRVMKRSFPFVLLISTLLLPPRVEYCCFMPPLIILTFPFSFRSKFIIDETMHFSSLFTNWFGVEGRTEHATMHLRAQSSARMNWLAICDVRKKISLHSALICFRSRRQVRVESGRIRNRHEETFLRGEESFSENFESETW